MGIDFMEWKSSQQIAISWSQSHVETILSPTQENFIILNPRSTWAYERYLILDDLHFRWLASLRWLAFALTDDRPFLTGTLYSNEKVCKVCSLITVFGLIKMRSALEFRIQINLRSIKVVSQLPLLAKTRVKVILVALLSATLMELQL